MSDYIFPLLLLLILLAALLRDTFVVSLLYLFAGVFFLGRLWSERALHALTYHRSLTARAFLGEEIRVRLEVRNSGWLPAVWIRMTDGVPAELSHATSFRRVISLLGRSALDFEYVLTARKRGIYPVGPLTFQTGDLFGLAGFQRRSVEADVIIVYPKILPLPNFSVLSKMPLGTMAFNQPIFEDPNRVVGKRAYIVGDPLRRVDWKATASSDQLQVKVYEPSISIDAALFVNLNLDEYHQRRWFDATELAIITAASIANWLVEHRQAVGLVTNGALPHLRETLPAIIPPRKGRPHLMRILETLAGIQTARGRAFAQVLRRESVSLPWGTTLIVISGDVRPDVFAELLQIRRRGLRILIILVGLVKDRAQFRKKAEQTGMVVEHISRVEDLKALGNWRYSG